MKIKTGDNIIVISGKSKGVTGTVVRAYPRDKTVLIDGVNIKKLHRKSKGQGQAEPIEKAFPIDVSNVAIVDPKTSKPSRVGKKKVGDSYVRITRKSESEL